MAVRSTAEEMERLQLSDDDTENFWDSPSKRQTRQTPKQRSSEEPIVPEARTMQDSGDSAFDREEAREAALRNELQNVRNINEVLEGLLSSIDRAKGNMEVGAIGPIFMARSNTLSFRPYRKQLLLLQPFSTHGLGYCHRPNIISD